MGGLFSRFKSSEKKNNNSLLPANENRSNTRNTRNNDSEIFEKIINIYVQRHAASCANTIEKVFNKKQKEKSRFAADSNISYVGVQQCLQVSDYFNKNQINKSGENTNKKPLLIFCCSELIRTQQTLFLSWIRYLENYKKNNGKIIVIPWLKEVSAPKIGSFIINKDNYPSSFTETKSKWTEFIQNLKNNIENIKKDTCNPDNNLIDDISKIENIDDWESLFYLSSVIYKKQENAQNRFSNNAKKIKIKIKGLLKKMGDLSQFMSLFGKILSQYLLDQEIDLNNYNGIELVMVAHHNSAEKFMEFLLPSTHSQFKEIQLVNCEVVRLPGECMKNYFKKIPTQGRMERIFPMIFNNDSQIFNKNLSISIGDKKVYPLFILYIASLDLFLSVNNIIKTGLKAQGVNEKVKIKKPLHLFLQTSIYDYKKQLVRIQKYIKIIDENYKNKSGETFYNYEEMIKKITQKMIDLNIYMSHRQSIHKQFQPGEIIRTPIKAFIENKMNNQLQLQNIMRQKEIVEMIERKKLTSSEIYSKLKDYLFDFCKLTPEDIDSIAVF
jgi:hypothetical protein